MGKIKRQRQKLHIPAAKTSEKVEIVDMMDTNLQVTFIGWSRAV
jgi:hypothetical protein